MKTFFLGLAGIFCASLAQAQIQLPKPVPTKPIPNCVVPKVDGDKVPFPLREANTKFELAENETYLLNGYIITQQGKPYFRVDFDSQPWLATHKRLQFPYFAINANDISQLKMSTTELVQIAVVARKDDLSTQGQEWSSNLTLQVITAPVPVNDSH